MASKKVTVKKIKDSSEATALLLGWFERENKPVTPQYMTDALGSVVSKPMVTKILEEQAQLGKLACKDLKKVRFYFLNPESASSTVGTDAGEGDGNTADAAAADEPAEQAAAEDRVGEKGAGTSDGGGDDEDAAVAAAEAARQRKEAVEALLALAEAQRAADAELEQLRARPTADERAARIRAAQTEVAAEERCIECITAQAREAAVDGGGGAAEAEADLSVLVWRYHAARALWRERKEYTQRLIDGVLGDACRPEELADMFGTTSDEEAGVSLQATAVVLPAGIH